MIPIAIGTAIAGALIKLQCYADAYGRHPDRLRRVGTLNWAKQFYSSTYPKTLKDEKSCFVFNRKP